MEAAVGGKFLATVTTEVDRRDGSKRNRIGMFYEEGDKEFVGVGASVGSKRYVLLHRLQPPCLLRTRLLRQRCLESLQPRRWVVLSPLRRQLLQPR